MNVQIFSVQKSHQPVDSNFKPFCCGLCAKDFKRKGSVPPDFKRYSDRLRFTVADLVCCQ